MQTELHPRFREHPEADAAESILRSCVHCGFCNATCPTYLDLGDERDGPRGRIYLIKQLLEDGHAGRRTQQHLDRCLTCRACETTCPSGVKYGELADIGRQILETEVPRPLRERWLRFGLRQLVAYPKRLAPLLAAGRWLERLLPRRLAVHMPPRQSASPWPPVQHARKLILLAGCVQAVVTPQSNAAAARVLDRLGITAIEANGAGCCGALSQHLGAASEAATFMRRNIDAWRPHLEAGAEAIVACATGCGAMLKDYGRLLRDDPDYRHDAGRVTSLVRDLSEVLDGEDLAPLRQSTGRVALHSPCTLSHALRQHDTLRRVLVRGGVDLTETVDDHLCCGSAGSYSLTQPDMARRLRARKLSALTLGAPERIVTANIGCQLHLGAASDVPVQHWIELFDDSRAAP